jgi:uncharacterized protein involved in response to NO
MAKQHNSPSEHILKRRDYDGPLFLKQGFRPFFLGAGLWSAFAMAVWLFFLYSGEPAGLFDYFPAQDWHIHEMLYGFLPAAIAGFLLTAVPNWTGRLPVRGLPLGLLAILWLAGRIAVLAPIILPERHYIFIGIIDSLFLFSFASLLAREILAGNNWKNVPVVAIVLALATSNILYHMRTLDLITAFTSSQIALAAILLTVMLVTLIGGRIVPSFTRNWMVRNKVTPLPAPRDLIDKVGSLLIPASMVMLLFMENLQITAILCIITAAVHLYRLSRWQGLKTFSEPLVFVLHIGYGWIGVGFFLAGLSILTDTIPMVAAIHAFTAGMFGSMILAVMTRATRGHTQQPLEADLGTTAIYVLVNLSAVIRVAAAIWGHSQWGYMASGLAWIAAFSLFSILYLPFFIKR